MFALVVVLFLLFLAILWGSERREVSNCAAFYDWPAAQASFERGNKKLDWNHDGIACNNLYTEWHKTHLQIP